MSYKIFKRCFDFTSATLLFICISPFFLLLTLLVRMNLGAPVFFKQVRSGKGRKPFQIFKFRTMTNGRDAEGNLLPDEQRMTKFGSWLRSTSFDELPELFNIISGDMSVIGPRPLPPAYDDYYTDTEMKRFNVRGGLIPPESLYYDSFVTWDKQLQYEADYADSVSFCLDVKILISVFKTIFVRIETGFGDFVRKPLNVERANMKDRK